MRLVAVIILVPGKTSNLANVPCYEVLSFAYEEKMRCVAMVIVVPGKICNSATVSSYEKF